MQFDRPRRLRTLHPGMKSFLVLVFTACGLLSPALADIPAPQPTSITVTNLAAFPKYKFSYVAEDSRQEAKPIQDGRPFKTMHSVQLLIQNGTEPAQVWAKIRHEWRGQKITVNVESVRQQEKAISVTYKTTSGNPAPGRKNAHTAPGSLPLFALAGMGACGLVLLARRGRKTP